MNSVQGRMWNALTDRWQSASELARKTRRPGAKNALREMARAGLILRAGVGEYGYRDGYYTLYRLPPLGPPRHVL